MNTVVWIVVGIVLGLVARVVAPRGGIGGWVGDVVAGVIGAGFGAYMVETVGLGQIFWSYPFWNLVFAGGVATGFVLVLRALTNQHGIEDEEPVVVRGEP